MESTKDKMLAADPNLERRMTIRLGIEKMLTPFHKLYNRKKTTTLQINSDKILQRVGIASAGESMVGMHKALNSDKEMS